MHNRKSMHRAPIPVGSFRGDAMPDRFELFCWCFALAVLALAMAWQGPVG